MRKEQLFDLIGEIDERKAESAYRTVSTAKRTRIPVKRGVLAACLCLLLAAAIPFALAMIPNQATDVFREGNLIEIKCKEDLPAVYDGELLAFRLDFDSYEFYYDADGDAQNTDDWYSLLAHSRNKENAVLLHCMFGDTTVEDWKVDTVFTKKATKTETIHGIEVQIARMELSLQYQYWHYAVFEYDDVVYDIRVQSDDPDDIYEILNKLLVPQKNKLTDRHKMC